MTTDSTQDTRWHIHLVQDLLDEITSELTVRSLDHDRSKLQPPEVEILDVVTERLNNLTYGSDEYKACLAAMTPMTDHHYAVNRHHPEHYPAGVDGMDLLDVVEMLADWTAACRRHADGDILKSLEINQERFGLSPQLYRILVNTVTRMGWAERGQEEAQR